MHVLKNAYCRHGIPVYLHTVWQEKFHLLYLLLDLLSRHELQTKPANIFGILDDCVV